jgi:hypothetical protein
MQPVALDVIHANPVSAELTAKQLAGTSTAQQASSRHADQLTSRSRLTCRHALSRRLPPNIGQQNPNCQVLWDHIECKVLHTSASLEANCLGSVCGFEQQLTLGVALIRTKPEQDTAAVGAAIGLALQASARIIVSPSSVAAQVENVLICIYKVWIALRVILCYAG